MALDPRRLKPGELRQLLNSHPILGQVATAAVIRKHRAEAGLRIGDGETVDFFRYLAWLVRKRHERRPAQQTESDAGQRLLEMGRANAARLMATLKGKAK